MEVMSVMFPYSDPGYMGWTMLGSVLLWITLVAVAVFAIVRLSPSPRRDDAVTVLKERLARGEITPEEYQARHGLIVGR
jgi:uncharacterized membrane protein